MPGHSTIDPFTKSKQNIFALIIGIDDYINCGKLRGAVSDAKAMKEYLEQVLRVPEDHIRTLFDQNATRDAIIQAFKDLQKDERIEKGNPIVVFYAGHGGELPSPASWTWWDPKSTIQCLLSRDYDGSYIHPIPDRAVGSLIEGIAKAKGDNIVNRLHVPYPRLLTMTFRVSSLIVAILLPGLEATMMDMYLGSSSLIIPSPKTSTKTSGEIELGRFIPNSPIMVFNRMSCWPPVARTSSLMSMQVAASSLPRF